MLQISSLYNLVTSCIAHLFADFHDVLQYRQLNCDMNTWVKKFVVMLRVPFVFLWLVAILTNFLIQMDSFFGVAACLVSYMRQAVNFTSDLSCSSSSKVNVAAKVVSVSVTASVGFSSSLHGANCLFLFAFNLCHLRLLAAQSLRLQLWSHPFFFFLCH